ncbi:MAG: hypothetical protein KGL39_21050 [Patescibacteria group bacterium]|nr:hypothetical protein [Patescibacteria group bacterium]
MTIRAPTSKVEKKSPDAPPAKNVDVSAENGEAPAEVKTPNTEKKETDKPAVISVFGCESVAHITKPEISKILTDATSKASGKQAAVLAFDAVFARIWNLEFPVNLNYYQPSVKKPNEWVYKTNSSWVRVDADVVVSEVCKKVTMLVIKLQPFNAADPDRISDAVKYFAEEKWSSDQTVRTSAINHRDRLKVLNHGAAPSGQKPENITSIAPFPVFKTTEPFTEVQFLEVLTHAAAITDAHQWAAETLEGCLKELQHYTYENPKQHIRSIVEKKKIGSTGRASAMYEALLKQLAA